MFLNDWELYKKPKGKKRFWIWSVNDSFWSKDLAYVDDKGIDTDGNTYYSAWDKLEKIKHENEYIDIEVDWED
jgi:hypothetical protein